MTVLDRLGGGSVVCGIFGHPIAHTMSPYMQTMAMGHMGFDGVYVPFHVLPERLGDAVRGMVALGIRGVNTTVPHKQDVIRHLDDVTDAARAIGAVNTVVNDDGVLTGDNTDVYGFTEGLLRADGIDGFPARVCVLGAGGATRSIVYGSAMRDEVGEVVIINRTHERAVGIARDFDGLNGTSVRACPADEDSFRKVVPECGLVVNATTLGIHRGDPSPIPDPSLLHEGQIVYEINAVPFISRFLLEGRARGARVIDGLPFLAFQGARSLSLWTGRDAPSDYMLDLVRKRLSGATDEPAAEDADAVGSGGGNGNEP